MKKGIREGEKEVGGDGVCSCSFGEPLKQETCQTPDPSCRCGANREDSRHFFFDCCHYANMRYKLFHNLN
jgi:hypothetical protein